MRKEGKADWKELKRTEDIKREDGKQDTRVEEEKRSQGWVQFTWKTEVI